MIAINFKKLKIGSISCRGRQLLLRAGPGGVGEQGVPLPGDLRQQPAGVPRRAKHSATRPRDLRRARVGPRPRRHLAGHLLRHFGLLNYRLCGTQTLAIGDILFYGVLLVPFSDHLNDLNA